MEQDKVDAFAERVFRILNDGSLALMISLGHRTGLFDAMDGMIPATSKEIADAAKLNERYVREWLGAMVAGRIVVYAPAKGHYHLPAEHSASLASSAAPNNLAAFMQYVSLLGSAEDGIVECFRNGGGLSYSAFPRFQEVMAEDSGQSVLPALLDNILPLVPGLVNDLRHGISVLDVGCGSGRALNIMGREFPQSHFVGYDLSEDGITRGRMEAQRLGLTNVHLEVRDVTALNEPELFDFITAFDAVHDQAHPRMVLREIAKSLRPHGTFLMQDIHSSTDVTKNMENPAAPFLYTVSCMHCMTVSLSAYGEGLGAMWGEEKALEYLREAGFTKVEVERLPHDFQNSYFIARKD